MDDPEIKAMATIAKELDQLEEEQRVNVLLYINTRYSGSAGNTTRPPARGAAPMSPPEEFDNIGEFFDAANPTTDSDRAVVVGYWLQVIEGEEDFESAAVNKHLKNLGHAVSNVTRAFGNAMNKSPRLVIQTSKSGSSKQARKKYKITREGIKRVKKMLAQEGAEDDAE
ncbi:MAG: hypothetical protein H6814_09400 [Phycisphaeraceae bacterium]|nr:hypothetical protein [Phycisphaeraceae bacterium]